MGADTDLLHIHTLMRVSSRRSSSSQQQQTIPQYIFEAFSKWTASKESVVLDIRKLNKSYPALTGLLLEKESVCNLVAMERVNAVFRWLLSIECRKIGKVNPPTYIPLLIAVLEVL